jgi:hypothetical protein
LKTNRNYTIKLGVLLFSSGPLYRELPHVNTLWHVDQLLGGDREIDDCTAARKQQRNGVFCAVR